MGALPYQRRRLEGRMEHAYIIHTNISTILKIRNITEYVRGQGTAGGSAKSIERWMESERKRDRCRHATINQQCSEILAALTEKRRDF